MEDAGLAAGRRGEQWLHGRLLVVDAAVASALAALLAPTSIWFVWQSGARRADRLLLVGAICLGHAVVLARRRRPVVAYVVACAVMLVLVLVPDLAPGGRSPAAGQLVPPILLPSALVYPVLLYAVAAWTSRPRPAIALGAGLVGVAVVMARLAESVNRASAVWTRGGDVRLATTAWDMLVLAALVATVLAPWGLGRYRAVRAAYVAALEERARKAEAERARLAEQAVAAERVRIAREMHDVIAHSLVVMVRQAEGGRFAGVQDPGLAIRALTTLADTGREALADMRALLAALRGDGCATESEPQPTLERLPALVERVRAAGLPVRMTVEGAPRPVHRAVSLAAYRLVQEGLTNVVKHARPGVEALVSVDWTGPGLDIGQPVRPLPPHPRPGSTTHPVCRGAPGRPNQVSSSLNGCPSTATDWCFDNPNHPCWQGIRLSMPRHVVFLSADLGLTAGPHTGSTRPPIPQRNSARERA